MEEWICVSYVSVAAMVLLRAFHFRDFSGEVDRQKNKVDISAAIFHLPFLEWICDVLFSRFLTRIELLHHVSCCVWHGKACRGRFLMSRLRYLLVIRSQSRTS